MNLGTTKTACAAVATALLFVTPAIAAQSNAANSPASQQQTERRGGANAQKIVDAAAKSVKQMKSDQRLDQLMREAKGVFIVPTFVKGAVIVGGEGGKGVLLEHKGAAWSDPAFFSIASGSVGAQVGGEAGPMVMLLMSDKALNEFTGGGNFSLNANAGLTIVNYSARGQSNVGKGDIIVWSGTSGGYVGANVSGTNITPDTATDQSYYGKQVSTRQIMAGSASNPDANDLKNEMPS